MLKFGSTVEVSKFVTFAKFTPPSKPNFILSEFNLSPNKREINTWLWAICTQNNKNKIVIGPNTWFLHSHSNQDIIPKGYKNTGGRNVAYIVTRLGHQISGNDWTTELSAYPIVFENGKCANWYHI